MVWQEQIVSGLFVIAPAEAGKFFHNVLAVFGKSEGGAEFFDTHGIIQFSDGTALPRWRFIEFPH